MTVDRRAIDSEVLTPNQFRRYSAMPTIPKRFTDRVYTHLLGNLLNARDFPVILWIVGDPGMGKTWQLRRYLEICQFQLFSVSSADLESKNAGEPAKLLQRRYLEASRVLGHGKPAAMIVDDIDTTVGEWENHTETVNHRAILAFLMHIADNPTHIESVGLVNRVPIFFTGNDPDRLYAPLVRDGRTSKFEWLPTLVEKTAIVSSILGVSHTDQHLVERLVEQHPDMPISFFSQLIVERAVSIVSELETPATFSALLRGDPELVSRLQHTIEIERAKTDWLKNATRLATGGTSDA